MLHYFACNFFAPVLVSPRLLLSGIVEVYLLNDRFVPVIDGEIRVDIYNWTSMVPIKTDIYSASATPLSSVKQDIELDLWEQYDETEVFLKFTLTAEGVDKSPENFVFPKPFKMVKELPDPKIDVRYYYHHYPNNLNNSRTYYKCISMRVCELLPVVVTSSTTELIAIKLNM